jgi:choline dehydrogenase-like flavoprotein
MRVAVVGSGLSGFAVAEALAARGVHVTILDVGETLDEQRAAVVARLHDLPRQEWPGEDLAFLGANSTIGRGVLPKKVYFGSDGIYATNRPFSPITTTVDGRAPAPTFTKGGFSTVWGGASLPVDAVDMTDWPVSRAELDPYFQRVADLMPLCGGAGTLSEAFPPYKEPLGDLEPGPQGRLLLEDLERAAPRLTRTGTLYGKARLAIHTSASAGGVLPCNGCGYCFTGCVRGSIYSTLPQLQQLTRRPNVEYRSGIHVDTVGEAGLDAFVEGMDLAANTKVRFTFDAVFLAAGPLSSTRVLLRSRGLYDRLVALKETQKFVLPMLRGRGAPTAIEHPTVTMASVFLETKVRALSEHWVHAQIIPMNPLVFDAGPLPGKTLRGARRLWRPALRHMMIAWCSMHSDHSSTVEVTLRRDAAGGPDRLELNPRGIPAARAAARTAAWDLFRKGLMFNTVFVPPMMKLANPGSEAHCGGSFPMRKAPRDQFESDTFGRPFGWTRIFAVDSSVLPSIPGTTLAFSVMANASRIGSQAPLGR